MELPHCVKEVVLTGHGLTLDSFIAVARFGARVRVSDEAMQAMIQSRELAERISREKRVAYGIIPW